MRKLILTSLLLLCIFNDSFAQSFGRGGQANFKGGAITLGIKFPDGTVALPSLAFSSGTDNGFYWIGTDNFAASTNGVKLLDFLTTGISLIPTTAQLILPISNDSSTPTLTFGDGNTGFYESTDNVLRVAINGGAFWEISSSVIGSANSAGAAIGQSLASAINPSLLPNKGDVNTGLGWTSTDIMNFIAGGITIVSITEAASEYVTHLFGTVYDPSLEGVNTVAADATIAINATIVRVVGDGGAVLLDTDPAIADGAADGQMIIIQGTGNVVTIADAVNTALAGSVSMALGQGDTIQLIWDSGDSVWYEVSRSDN